MLVLSFKSDWKEHKKKTIHISLRTTGLRKWKVSKLPMMGLIS